VLLELNCTMSELKKADAKFQLDKKIERAARKRKREEETKNAALQDMRNLTRDMKPSPTKSQNLGEFEQNKAQKRSPLRRRLSAADMLGEGSQRVPRGLTQLMGKIREAEEAHYARLRR